MYRIVRRLAPFLFALVVWPGHGSALAQTIEVANAWARSTMPGQSVGGVFMDITADAPVRLAKVESPVAGRTELHHMKVENNIMRMQAVERIDVAPGKPARLTPGGYHVMLMDLRRPLKPGERIELALTFEAAGGERRVVKAHAQVRDAAAASAAHAPAHKH